MCSLQSIFENIIYKQNITIIWGNLFRYPDLLSYCLNNYFAMNDTIRIYSQYWERLNFSDLYENDGTICDNLIWIEPNFTDTIVKPDYAKRLIVITSHLNLNIPTKNTLVIGNYLGDVFQKPINFLGFVENISDDPFEFRPNLFTKENNFIPSDAYICINLMDCESSNEAYLCLLNAIESLKHCQGILGWTIAIEPSHKKSLKLNLEMANRKFIKNYQQIKCNVDGINIIKDILLCPVTIL